MTLGQKLKEIRKRFGLSQEQLGEIKNVSSFVVGSMTENIKEDGIPDGGDFIIDIENDNISVEERHIQL